MEKRFIFFKSGKAKEVFDALAWECVMELTFGRLLEPLESVDFSKN